MNSELKDFLAKHRVAVLSLMQADNTLHSATVHYSCDFDQFTFYFQTRRETMKAQAALNSTNKTAAMVIGFSEDEWITVQLHGTIEAVTDPAALERVYTVHYAKLPETEAFRNAETVYLKFSPTWWRYSDFNTDPETIVVSK